MESSIHLALIQLSVYTLKMDILADMVEEARKSYITVSKPNVIVHSVDTMVRLIPL